jgi:hypothetical protein
VQDDLHLDFLQRARVQRPSDGKDAVVVACATSSGKTALRWVVCSGGSAVASVGGAVPPKSSRAGNPSSSR